MKLTLELPFPPSANVYWRKGRGGRIFVSKEAEEYKLDVIAAAMEQTDPADWPYFPVGRVFLQADCWMPQSNRDLGNTEKVLEDALEGIAYTNDNQIGGHTYWRYEARSPKRLNARVIVEVFPCPKR